MKRKIIALLLFAVALIGLPLITAPAASASTVFWGGAYSACNGSMSNPSMSGNYMGGTGWIYCVAGDDHQAALRITQQWADGSWHAVVEHIVVSYPGGANGYQSVQVYCPGSANRIYRVAWRHLSGDNPDWHYHNGVENIVQLPCSGFF